DFSATAIDAYRTALDIAAMSGGKIVLLHVIELPVINDPVLMPVKIFEQDYLRDLGENASTQFDKLISKYTSGAEVQKHIAFGAPYHQILAYASKHDADLIVMGSHGASGLRELLVGSNAEKIVRHANIPVLVIKKYNKAPIRNIVYPNTLHLDNMQDFT